MVDFVRVSGVELEEKTLDGEAISLRHFHSVF